EALLLGVVAALDVDRVRRAGPRAQLAADALLQPVRVAVEDVPAVVPRRGGYALLGVLLGDDLLEHVREGHAEAAPGAHDYSPLPVLSASPPVSSGDASSSSAAGTVAIARSPSTRRNRGEGGTTRSIGGTGKPPSCGGIVPALGGGAFSLPNRNGASSASTI